MNTPRLCFLSLVLLIGAAATPRLVLAADAEKGGDPKIYDQSLDGAKQVAAALAVARKENKRVLLQFGANWCVWCHQLHDLFKSDQEIAGVLKTGYVVVMIDVDEGHNKETDARYGHPTRFGLPVLVILDADGKQLTTKDTSELEKGKGHDPAKVLAFLKKWLPSK